MHQEAHRFVCSRAACDFVLVAHIHWAPVKQGLVVAMGVAQFEVAYSGSKKVVVDRHGLV